MSDLIDLASKALFLLTQKTFWVRFGTFAGGAALVLAGAFILMRKPLGQVADKIASKVPVIPV